MRHWLEAQANDWLSCLPPLEERTWLERQVAKWLDLDNTEWINPFRAYLFAFWVVKLSFKAISKVALSNKEE